MIDLFFKYDDGDGTDLEQMLAYADFREFAAALRQRKGDASA